MTRASLPVEMASDRRDALESILQSALKHGTVVRIAYEGCLRDIVPVAFEHWVSDFDDVEQSSLTACHLAGQSRSGTLPGKRSFHLDRIDDLRRLALNVRGDQTAGGVPVGTYTLASTASELAVSDILLPNALVPRSLRVRVPSSAGFGASGFGLPWGFGFVFPKPDLAERARLKHAFGARWDSRGRMWSTHARSADDARRVLTDALAAGYVLEVRDPADRKALQAAFRAIGIPAQLFGARSPVVTPSTCVPNAVGVWSYELASSAPRERVAPEPTPANALRSKRGPAGPRQQLASGYAEAVRTHAMAVVARLRPPRSNERDGSLPGECAFEDAVRADTPGVDPEWRDTDVVLAVSPHAHWALAFESYSGWGKHFPTSRSVRAYLAWRADVIDVVSTLVGPKLKRAWWGSDGQFPRSAERY